MEKEEAFHNFIKRCGVHLRFSHFGFRHLSYIRISVSRSWPASSSTISSGESMPCAAAHQNKTGSSMSLSARGCTGRLLVSNFAAKAEIVNGVAGFAWNSVEIWDV
jgi:hypothetical protein